MGIIFGILAHFQPPSVTPDLGYGYHSWNSDAFHMLFTFSTHHNCCQQTTTVTS